MDSPDWVCAHVCSRVLTCAHVCSSVLKCARVYSHVLKCAQVCSSVLACTHMCSRVLTCTHMCSSVCSCARYPSLPYMLRTVAVSVSHLLIAATENRDLGAPRAAVNRECNSAEGTGGACQWTSLMLWGKSLSHVASECPWCQNLRAV